MSWKKKNSSYKKALIVILIFALGAGLSLYFYKTAQSKVEIGGDVYTGGDLNNITVKSNSVISASGKISSSVTGSNYRIPDYQESDNGRLSQLVSIEQANKIISKLKKLAAIPITSGEFTQTQLNKNGFPEGTVWYKEEGDLTINTIEFKGKGTIIVENGDLYINGNITYNGNASVGFIVREGNINIKPQVNKLRGAYYATGKITFEN